MNIGFLKSNEPVANKFIEEILEKGRQAKEKVQLEFSVLSFEQLNWKPSVESWSIAHLIASHNAYFPDLEKITKGDYKMNFWEIQSLYFCVWANHEKPTTGTGKKKNESSWQDTAVGK